MSNYAFARVITERKGSVSLEIDNGEGEKRLYRDLSTNKESVMKIAEKINRGRVSLVHIEEIIEDFLP